MTTQAIALMEPSVMEETSTTLQAPQALTDDQLADFVIASVQKIRSIIPYIVALKQRFDGGRRDSTNRLKTPIKGCHSWQEFCFQHLDRSVRAVSEALTEAKGIQSTCEKCGEVFPSKSKLKKHERKLHPEMNQRPIQPIEDEEMPTDEPKAPCGSPEDKRQMELNAAKELERDFPELYAEVCNGEMDLASARLTIRPSPDEVYGFVEAELTLGKKNDADAIQSVREMYKCAGYDPDIIAAMIRRAIRLYRSGNVMGAGGSVHRRHIYHLGDIHGLLHEAKHPTVEPETAEPETPSNSLTEVSHEVKVALDYRDRALKAEALSILATVKAGLALGVTDANRAGEKPDVLMNDVCVAARCDSILALEWRRTAKELVDEHKVSDSELHDYMQEYVNEVQNSAEPSLSLKGFLSFVDVRKNGKHERAPRQESRNVWAAQLFQYGDEEALEAYVESASRRARQEDIEKLREAQKHILDCGFVPRVAA